jgi:predicted TIM-barrel fold metal-dependent hydrolase
MYVVDGQAHLWGANTPERPWPAGGPGREHRPVPLDAETLPGEMDAAGVDRVVIVPPTWEGDRNDIALAAAQRYPDRFAVMGRVVQNQPMPQEALDRWRDQPGMLGLRVTFGGATLQPDGWLTDGTMDWLWPAAERAGLPLMVYAPRQAVRVGEIAARHPGLRLIIDHFGLGREHQDAAFGPAIDELLLPAARHPNVAVKASAAPTYSTEPYPFPKLRDPIRRVVEAFGPQRVFWGSDFSRLPCSYRQCVTHFTEELGLTEPNKEWVMGRGIAEWLRWPLPAA